MAKEGAVFTSLLINPVLLSSNHFCRGRGGRKSIFLFSWNSIDSVSHSLSPPHSPLPLPEVFSLGWGGAWRSKTPCTWAHVPAGVCSCSPIGNLTGEGVSSPFLTASNSLFRDLLTLLRILFPMMECKHPST